MKPVKSKLQVRHYPQIPCNPFCIDVKDEYEAKKIVDVLANQHLWLYENNYIGDYSNVLEVVMLDVDEYGAREWSCYFNEDEAMDWDELVEAYLENDTPITDLLTNLN